MRASSYWAALAIAAIGVPAVLIGTSRGSDHADTAEIFHNPGFDISDVYLFESPSDSSRVCMAMNVHPIIGRGQSGGVSFDPNVLYQFKIDTTGDYVEDLVIQARFQGTGNQQQVMVSAPLRPARTGNMTTKNKGETYTGKFNKVNDSGNGIKFFAGPREDSFFFDLEQFFNILPDRATPINGIPVANPNDPQSTTWRPAGQAVDFLSNNGLNVLSIVVELPKSMLSRGGKGSNVIGLWCTTSVPKDGLYIQKDRLARPVINEVFATVANDRHKANDEDSPIDDAGSLKNDMESFLVHPAGRSEAIRNVLEAVLVPDVLKADLNGNGSAYLGYETGGATGGTFGGRKLDDDVVDISLGAVFGTTVSDLGLAPADGHDIPTLTSDHVGPEGKHFTSTFPYLGSPR